MADSPSSNTPAPRLDRGALERVLARAAELQGSGSGDPSDEFSDQQIIDLGKEVGLSPQVIRQALAEERTRSVLPAAERGVAAAVFGPGRIGAARTVAGKPADLLSLIDAWMQQQELLIVKRHHADRIVWEPRTDFLVNVKRAFRPGGRTYSLSHAFEVSATVMAVDDTRSHIGLDADFRQQYRRAGGTVAGSAVVGALLTGALIAMSVTPAVAAIPVVAAPFGGFFGARGGYRNTITRAHLALEQLLDRIERGEFRRRGADGLLDVIAAAANAFPRR